ncbi:gamma-glutamylcyclotransferase [Variovorax sp. OV329]|uniref:gamma-glutamylcyclotransferase n=1 Tax=Variovorax sp. OV329 TaxID=1882825 RepID=UPI0008EA5915|nr:gamma-glutamylcyclotransferase [Variovorax sp. OV329]SFM20327.1 cation transport protein ChaC [Variovorax sp. OV329]
MDIPLSGFDASEQQLTRQRLALGTLVDTLRANPSPGVRVRSDEQLQQTLEEALSEHDPTQDVHVFGYGSLMWNPAMDAAEVRPARVRGWHRSFCLRTFIGRGTPQEPGAMLGLDRGGACRGLLFRIEARKARAELQLLWRREMFAGAYDARWVAVDDAPHGPKALAFVVNRKHERYIGGHPAADVARLICTGRGVIGTSRAYYDAMVRALDQHGIRDAGMARLRTAVLQAQQALGAG